MEESLFGEATVLHSFMSPHGNSMISCLHENQSWSNIKLAHIR